MTKILSVSILLIVSLSNMAAAASLQNKDSQKYDIRVKGTSTMSTSIDGGVIKNNICSSSCTIEVKNVGSIDASGSDKIVIKNGKLEKH
jgi:hypothetical protein